MKLFKLVNSNETLGEIFQLRMQPVAALRIALNIKRIDEHLIAYDKSEKKLFKEYGEEKVVKGKDIVEIPKKNVAPFNKAREELLNSDVEIALKTISIEDITDEAGLKPSQLTAVSWLFNEFAEEAEKTKKKPKTAKAKIAKAKTKKKSKIKKAQKAA